GGDTPGVAPPAGAAADPRARRGVVALPVGAGHRHASEPDRRHAQRAMSQLPVFHEVSSGDDEDLASAYPRARGRSRTLAPRRARGLRKASGENRAPLAPANASDRTTGPRPDRARRAAIEGVPGRGSPSAILEHRGERARHGLADVLDWIRLGHAAHGTRGPPPIGVAVG